MGRRGTACKRQELKLTSLGRRWNSEVLQWIHTRCKFLNSNVSQTPRPQHCLPRHWSLWSERNRWPMPSWSVPSPWAPALFASSPASDFEDLLLIPTQARRLQVSFPPRILSPCLPALRPQLPLFALPSSHWCWNLKHNCWEYFAAVLKFLSCSSASLGWQFSLKH